MTSTPMSPAAPAWKLAEVTYTRGGIGTTRFDNVVINRDSALVGGTRSAPESMTRRYTRGMSSPRISAQVDALTAALNVLAARHMRPDGSGDRIIKRGGPADADAPRVEIVLANPLVPGGPPTTLWYAERLAPPAVRQALAAALELSNTALQHASAR